MNALRIAKILVAVFFVINFFSIAIAEEFRYDSRGKRDPFSVAAKGSSLLEGAGTLAQLKLEGVVVDPKGKSVAIVNGEMFTEGARIGDSVTIKKITDKGVEFESEGKIVNIPIVTKDE